MGKDGCSILMVLASAAVVGQMMVGTSGAQMVSPPPAPSSGVDCSGALASAASCFDYVSEGSNLTSPSSACCSGIKSLLTKSPVCLCQLVANSGSLGLPIDRKRELGLPNACKFSAPPLSACSLLGVPIPGPSEAPSPAEIGGKAPMSSKRPASPSPSPAAGGISEAPLSSSPSPAAGGISEAPVSSSPSPAAGGISEAPVSSSPSPAPGGGPSPDCNTAYISAFSCLDYITSGSKQTSPSSDCCSGIKNLITNEPVCLCQLLGSTPPTGISIDRKRALGLPGACKVAGLPPNYCSKIGSPASDPSAAPSPPADVASTPGPPTLAPGGSEPVTASSPGNGNGNSIRRFGFRPSVLLSTAIAMIMTGATIAIF